MGIKLVADFLSQNILAHVNVLTSMAVHAPDEITSKTHDKKNTIGLINRFFIFILDMPCVIRHVQIFNQVM